VRDLSAREIAHIAITGSDPTLEESHGGADAIIAAWINHQPDTYGARQQVATACDEFLRGFRITNADTLAEVERVFRVAAQLSLDRVINALATFFIVEGGFPSNYFPDISIEVATQKNYAMTLAVADFLLQQIGILRLDSYGYKTPIERRVAAMLSDEGVARQAAAPFALRHAADNHLPNELFFAVPSQQLGISVWGKTALSPSTPRPRLIAQLEILFAHIICCQDAPSQQQLFVMASELGWGTRMDTETTATHFWRHNAEFEIDCFQVIQRSPRCTERLTGSSTASACEVFNHLQASVCNIYGASRVLLAVVDHLRDIADGGSPSSGGSI
jgi:hypothetical protein